MDSDMDFFVRLFSIVACIFGWIIAWRFYRRETDYMIDTFAAKRFVRIETVNLVGITTFLFTAALLPFFFRVNLLLFGGCAVGAAVTLALWIFLGIICPSQSASTEEQ